MYEIRWYHFVVGLFCLGVALGKTLLAPELLDVDSQGHGIRSYHGIVRNGETVVDLNPPLRAKDHNHQKGCIGGYKVYKSGPLPFQVELKNRHTGEAQIVLQKGATNLKEKYRFSIAAYLCADENIVSKQAVITIHVNGFAPEWIHTSEVLEVVEGRLFPSIMKLKVNDQDTLNNFGQICHYRVLTPNVPFTINEDGVLSNTKKLDYGKQKSYIIKVEAEDCGGLKSQPLLVTIKVKQICKLGWKGIDNKINYTPASERKLLAEEAKLELCETPCQHGTVTAKIHLQTSHIGKGCDRDTYSIQSQRKLCGASSGGVDLLPAPRIASWTKSLPTDDGQESDQIYAFDGKTNAVEVPQKRFNHTLDKHFTISVWMKHENHDQSRHGKKENIVCNSDGEAMNRHHYSLFVHNCHLVFLMRQEYHKKLQNVFKPAEWRWRIPQPCDNSWHHYAVSVDFPQVRLYIDGKMFIATADNPEVVDDWPLHKTKNIHTTKLFVGACWQGGDKKVAQHFEGYLAGLSILKGKTESDRVIKCLNNCKEKLDFHAMSQMDTGMSLGFNSEMTQMTITGHNAAQVEKLVRRIGYINYRMFPTPGFRDLKIDTEVECEGKKIDIPVRKSMVMVLQADKPIITISGVKTQSHTEHQLAMGVHIFKDVNIVSHTKKEEEELGAIIQQKLKKAILMKDENSVQPDIKKTVQDEKYKIDACIITSHPELDLEHENFRMPRNLVNQLGLEVSTTKKGVIITGADKIRNYEQVLREMHYVNRRPEDFKLHEFKLICSELNGRFVSNEHKIQVDAIHKLHKVPAPQHHAADTQSVLNKPIKELHLEEKDSLHSSMGSAHTGTGIGMTVIIVVCVGFLIFMIVLGIIRIRAAHQRTQVVNVEEREEMEWDNSALNIIVNPMEQDGGSMLPYDSQSLHALRGEDSDSDDDGSSYHDELESSEDESEKIKDRELEWDDSTLSF